MVSGKKAIDLTGQVFTRLTVIKRVPAPPNNKARGAFWLCRCSCPAQTETVVISTALRNGHSKSCGCYSSDLSRERFTTHGGCSGGKDGPEYRTYYNMIDRCYNPKNKRFSSYMGRGIKVCPRWRENFANFLEDMGPKPEPKNKYSIERIDNDKDYEPANCKWATAEEQGRNKRKVQASLEVAEKIRKEYSESDITQAELGDKYGLNEGIVAHIIHDRTWKPNGGRA